MKHLGCKVEFERERIEALMRVFRQEIASCRQINITEVWKRVVETPCERFWISDYRAAIVVASMLRGESIAYMRPTKREMYEEIYRRTVEMIRRFPGRPLLHLVGEVVSQRAPKFYLAAHSARLMYHREVKKIRKKK